jgi:flagellar hook-associated protein 3 FlgL
MILNRATELARMQAFQRRNVAIHDALERAGTEMTTGLRTDLHAATGGNLGRLHGIERALERNASLQVNIVLVNQRLDATQATLTRIHDALDTAAIDLEASARQDSLGTAMKHAEAIRRDFADAVAALNVQVAGSSLFAGTATDRAALAPAEDILAQLDALVAAAPDAATVIAAVDAYFQPPGGGFYATGYLGTADDLEPVQVGEDRRVAGNLRADDARIVAALKGQALAAVVAGGALAGNDAERIAVFDEAGTQMIAAREGLVDLRASLGTRQQAVETARAVNNAERSALEITRAEIMGIDPAEAASRYQALEAQLEAAYTVTVRLASLRFSNFLR